MALKAAQRKLAPIEAASDTADELHTRLNDVLEISN